MSRRRRRRPARLHAVHGGIFLRHQDFVPEARSFLFN